MNGNTCIIFVVRIINKNIKILKLNLVRINEKHKLLKIYNDKNNNNNKMRDQVYLRHDPWMFIYFFELFF
jgi:hypothetical protein